MHRSIQQDTDSLSYVNLIVSLTLYIIVFTFDGSYDMESTYASIAAY